MLNHALVRGLTFLLLLANVSTLTSCVQPKSADGSTTYYVSHEVSDALLNASPCCSGVSEFHYEALAVPQELVAKIDNQSPVFNFSTGKSYFAAFKLPTLQQRATLCAYSYFPGGVFFPSLLFLDAQFRPVRQTAPSDTHYVAISQWEPARYELTESLSPGDPARYVIVLTTSDALSQRVRTRDSSQTYVSGGVYATLPGGPVYHRNEPTGQVKLVIKPLQ